VSTSENNWSSYLYLKDQKTLIFFIALALCGAAYLGYLTPILISELYSSYDSDTDFVPALKKIGILFVFEYFVQIIYQISLSRYVQLALQHIRSKSYSNWIRSYESVGIGKFGDTKYPLGEVLARVLSDTEAVIEMVGSGSFKIFIDFTYILSCLVSFITLNTTSGITLIIAEVLACILLIIGSKKMSVVYMAVRNSMGHMSRVVANITAGFRFTYYTPNRNYASNKSYDVFEDFLKKQLKANIWDAGYFSIAESLYPLLLVILVLIFPYSNITEMAVLGAIIDLIQRSISPIKEVASKISSIQRAKTGLTRIQEFNMDIQNLPTVSFEDSFKSIQMSALEVKVDHFSYPENRNEDKESHFSLDKIYFNANAGELIGIVGLSGSGKSTLLKILSTDILAKESLITLKGANNDEIKFSLDYVENIDSYKRQVSIVSQDSHVFTETLKFNIMLTNNADDSAFESFWNNVLVEIPYLKNWGVTPTSVINPKELSLGQKQLLSALRSCFLTKPIVLFDEISSGLDSDLEEALRKLVLLIQKKSLTIIVAHRIETIVNANQIIVMDKGQVECIGKHDDLVLNSATYQEFISQLKTLS
jgi:ATP-binding cassette subfamily B protein